MIVLVCGLPGTGKTYFAGRLAEEMKATHISSDVIRLNLLKERTYSEEEKEVVYVRMMEALDEELNRGREAVLDATFSLVKYRNLMLDLAKLKEVPLKIIRITASEEDIRQRTKRKRKDSEADFEIYLKLKKEFEAIDRHHLILNSSELPLDEMLYRAKIFLGK